MTDCVEKEVGARAAIKLCFDLLFILFKTGEYHCLT